jgi:hypothetical protein
MREKSRTSSIMASSVSAERRAVSSRRTVASAGSSSMASCSMPITPCSGVRISCDMLATNSLLAALASSARACASSSLRISSRETRTDGEPRPAPLGRARGERDVDAGQEDEHQLGDATGSTMAPLIDDHHPQQHRGVAAGREQREASARRNVVCT